MFAPPDSVSGKMQRIAVSFPRELVERIDDFRFERHIASRTEAIRQLVEVGLEATKAGLRKMAR